MSRINFIGWKLIGHWSFGNWTFFRIPGCRLGVSVFHDRRRPKLLCHPRWLAVPRVAGLVAALAATGARAEPAPAAVARLSPTPQKIEIRPDETYRFSARTTILEPRGLADRRALARLRRFLGAATAVTPGEVLLAGTPAELEKPLAALGVTAAEAAGLGPEGYAIVCGSMPASAVEGRAAAGRAADGAGTLPALVCAANTPAGIARALAALEQIGRFAPLDPGQTSLTLKSGEPLPGGRSVELPRLTILDRPAIPVRGIVEGFQGRPWSHAARLAMIAFAARHRMNLFVLAPADDPAHREKWREPPPPETLGALRELVAACAEEQVDFAYGLRPGETIRYSDEEDAKRLLARIDAVRDLGVRRWALLFDHPPKDLAHPADRERFPDLVSAQCALANRVWAYVQGKDADARLYFAPTEPWGPDDTAYARNLRERIDPSIAVLWLAPSAADWTLGEADAARAGERFGRAPILWDHFPIDDDARRRVFLGPLRGRAAPAASRLAGFVVNPMELAEASKIALATVADFAWNPAAYDPDRSWAAALNEGAGGRPAAAAALRKVAENSRTSWIRAAESPTLAPLLRAYEEKGEEEPLARELTDLAKVRSVLESAAPDPALSTELAPWTARLETECGRALEAIAMARALRGGKADAVWARRFALAAGPAFPPAPGAQAGASSPEDAVEVAGGALATFERRLADAVDLWLGVGPPASVASSLPAFESFAPAFAADGNPATKFWSGRPPAAGDHVTLDLGMPRLVGRVEILQGDPEHKESFLRDGLMEISPDGNAWKEIGSLHGLEERIDLHQPATARFVRARAVQPQERRLMVREFAAYALDDATVQTTMPVPEEGAALRAAADRRVETAFAASGPIPPRAHLTVDLRVPREVTRVSVLQDPSAFLKHGRLAVSVDGAAWDDAGEVRTPATRLEWTAPRRARYVRIEAAEASEGPVRIHEIGVGWK